MASNSASVVTACLEEPGAPFAQLTLATSSGASMK
jgi:hypothetical protein